ncbi:MAG: segregation/condensation protein A [Clostridia bacterium]|nr:segregation/condensation protein A [Clostridia bacterium]
MTFQVKDFDGPLELLLQLIAKAQIEIKDIFVSEITDQYIAYVNSAEFLDMEDATDFLVMAATLLEIKSRAMLPKPPPLEEGEEDPEAALIRRLEEYKAFRETATAMKAFEMAAGNIFSKLPDEFPLPPQETELVGMDLGGLMEALLRVLERKPAEDTKPEVNHYAPRDIHRDEHNVQECMLTLIKRVKQAERMRFEDVFSDAPTKEEVVTFFMALLELLKLGEMHVQQESTGSQIYLLAGRKPEEEIPDGDGEDDSDGRPKRRKRRASGGESQGKN